LRGLGIYGFRVFGVWGLGIRVQGLDTMEPVTRLVYDSVFRVSVSGIRVSY